MCLHAEMHPHRPCLPMADVRGGLPPLRAALRCSMSEFFLCRRDVWHAGVLAGRP